MDIEVSTSLLEVFKQKSFSVRVGGEVEPKDYKGSYEAGHWDFSMYEGEDLILERRALGLEFPLRSLLYRRTVRSRCSSEVPVERMLAVAITIFVWFTWNALPAD